MRNEITFILSGTLDHQIVRIWHPKALQANEGQATDSSVVNAVRVLSENKVQRSQPLAEPTITGTRALTRLNYSPFHSLKNTMVTPLPIKQREVSIFQINGRKLIDNCFPGTWIGPKDWPPGHESRTLWEGGSVR